MGHATLSPSSRHRWAACPGSVREEAKFPEVKSGPAAVDGTHSHTLLEHCIKQDLADPFDFIGKHLTDHEGDFTVDATRAQRVKVCVDYIRNRIDEQFGMCEVISEQRVNPAYLVGRNDMSGTVDVQILGSDGVVELIDYKDGAAPVEVKGNPQLEQYAYGVLASFGRPVNLPYPFETVRMTIVQPKLALMGGDAITSTDVPVTDMLTALGTIVAQAAATDNPSAPLVPGAAQCKYCRAKGSCAALLGSVNDKLTASFGTVDPMAIAGKDPTTLDGTQLAQIVEAAPLIRATLDAVEEEAKRRLEQGDRIEGLKLVRGRGSRSWSMTDEEMAAKLVKFGIPKSHVYTTKLVSPAQALALTWVKKDGSHAKLSDSQRERLTKEYIMQQEGKLTVALSSDTRPAVMVAPLNVEHMFSTVEPETTPEWM